MGWEQDVADAQRAAYAERRVLPIPAKKRRSPLRWLISFITGWMFTRWLWRQGFLGKIVALPAWAFWILLVLTLIGSMLPAVTPDTVFPSEYQRVGNWDVSLTSWSTSTRDRQGLPSGQFRWLITHWMLHNPTSDALELGSVDVSATSFGVQRYAASDDVGRALHIHPLPQGYLLPGQTVTGDIVVPIFRGAHNVKVSFQPGDGNDTLDAEVYTVTP